MFHLKLSKMETKRKLGKDTLSLTVPETSLTFCDATSVNFQPTSATLPVNFEAPKPKADKL